MCRDGLRKTRGHLELNLTKSAENYKNGFCRYVTQERAMKAYTLGNASMASR